jgi:hypothetical protein
MIKPYMTHNTQPGFQVFTGVSSVVVCSIQFDTTPLFSLLTLLSISIVLSYISMLYLPVVITVLVFPILNSFLLTSPFTEYLYASLIVFIFLEVMLFLAYFWWYFHNLSYVIGSLSLVSPLVLTSSTYYLIAGLLLSLLSFYLALLPILLFLVLSFSEFSNALDTTYLNDTAFVSLQLTIVFLHLLHLLVGLFFILSEISYPYYYHFIEVIWLLIGYCIYLQ